MGKEPQDIPSGTIAAEGSAPLPAPSAAPSRLHEIEGNLATVETIIADRRESWERFLAEEKSKEADASKAKIRHLLEMK